MKNIKCIAVATDGGLKRLAITYDEIDEVTGKVTKSNAKTNRVVTDEEASSNIKALEVFAQGIIDAE